MTALPDHLAFTLAAPLGSFSVDTSPAANSAVKTTERDPAKSAVVGMVAAAIGLDRDGVHDLGKSLSLSTMVVVEPTIARTPDFHTATPGRPLLDGPKGARLSTRHSRFEELVWSYDHRPPTRWSKPASVEGGLGTGEILSTRSYFTNGIWTITLHGPQDILERARVGLAKPRYPLCVGRKAFPIGLPPAPLLVSAATPEEAHVAYRRAHMALGSILQDHAADACEVIGPGEGRFTVDLSYPGERRKGRVVVRRDATAPYRPGLKNLLDRRVHIS